MICIRYFAWLREAVGVAHEEITLPDDVRTVGQFRGWIGERHPALQSKLAEPGVRIALDREFAAPDAQIGGAREIALLPPMTGG